MNKKCPIHIVEIAEVLTLFILFLVSEIYAAGQQDRIISISKGWNMISSPFAEPIKLSEIASTCKLKIYKGEIWAFNYKVGGGWIRSSQTEKGNGTYVLSSEDCTIEIKGTPTTFYQQIVKRGWNLVSADASFEEIKGSCQISAGKKIWNLNHQTQKWINLSPSDKLEPLKSYWIAVKDDCQLFPSGPEGKFREEIFNLYGFKKEATDFIRSNSSIVVLNLEDTCGGGGWRPWDKTVELNCSQHEVAVHELSHVWWHWYRLSHPDVRKSFVRDVVNLANLDSSQSPEYTGTIKLAKEYVYGILYTGGHKNLLCTTAGCVQDVNDIQDFEFGQDNDDITKTTSKINDWEIYAGFSSYTMGKFKDGPRKLPEFMWKYFEPEFTGNILTLPYYYK